MPRKSKPPAFGGTDKPVLNGVIPKKPGFTAGQSRLPKGMKQRPGGGKGGKPPRFPGRAGGR